MADVLKKVPVREQDPKVRATNFEEVCYGYNQEEAMEEASRCINCKNAKCIQGCPVGINIPAFVHEVKEGNIEEAYKIIGQSSALPAVCGREPCDPAPGPGHVQRRPGPEGEPGGVRLPPALCVRQPTVEVRGVRGADRPGGVCLGNARPL